MPKFIEKELFNSMDKIQEQINAKKDEHKAALTTAQDHAKNGDLDKAKEAKANAEAIKADIEKLEADLNELQAIVDEPVEEPASEQTDTEETLPKPDEEDELKKEQRSAAADPEEEDATQEEKKKQTEKETRGMKKMQTKVNLDSNKTALEDIGAFIKSKGKETRGLTSKGAEALIPVEVINQPKETPETVVDLRTIVNRVKVKTAEGKYPVLENPSDGFPTVEELAKNPEMEASPIRKVDYAIKTYRQQLPVSQEALDDSEADLGKIVADYIAKKSLITSNIAIASKMATFEKVTATSLDDLKKIVNVTIDPAYNIVHVVTQSFFNAVDTLKDGDGRYILQQDITSPSGYKLFGRNVYVVKDTIFGGEAGAQQAYVGSAYDGVLFADRAELGLKWVDNTIYGEILAGVLRFDAEVADPNAGRFVTLDLSGTEEPAAKKASK
ncbi:phage major capsid protein [Listeria monocytogenes]|uniref:Phage major capsid protein n=1 Tax=Listeria monocytogenes TaxID=1639 RepID=A0A823DG50_LISMN|nr:phage major capsid protein [Listeria monocytogenes]EAD1012206.1 phage major capsid protein [Listeria monocytogenes]EAD1186113.1 phage major capsid protein [Listeria monocytogenes]EAF8898032.1 phage major capsid protein [Listeria monocytogenes]